MSLNCSLFTVATRLEAEIKVGSRLVCSFSWLALPAICVNDSQERLQQMQNLHGFCTQSHLATSIHYCTHV